MSAGNDLPHTQSSTITTAGSAKKHQQPLQASKIRDEALSKVERKSKKLRNRHSATTNPIPGEMVHFDTKRLPLLQNKKQPTHAIICFVAIDDFSRELYAAILPDRTAASAAKFLLHDVIDCCPYTIECAYSDNGVEYRGNTGTSIRRCLRTKQYRTEVYPPSPTANQRKARRVIHYLDGGVA